MFKSIDETDKFSYTDCVISDIEKAEDGYIFNVEALIVKENNSQNSNFTESFAGPSKIKFVDGKLKDIVKVGFKYYNADSVLIKEVPDEITGLNYRTSHPLSNAEILELSDRMVDGETTGEALNNMGVLKQDKKKKK